MHRIRLIGRLHTFLMSLHQAMKKRALERVLPVRLNACQRIDLSCRYQTGSQRKHRIGHVHFDGLAFGLGKHAALDH